MDQKSFATFGACGLAITGFALGGAEPPRPAALPPPRPNIVLVIADDLGYGDLSCYGATRIATPNIDALAAGGRRFLNGYCSSATCTPSRYSLLTGRYAFRRAGTGIAPPNAPALIRPGTETVASLLRRAGYATAIIGKWHLGLGDKAPDWNGELKPGPLEIGFDHCLLLPTTNDRVPQVLVEDHRVRGLDPKDPLRVTMTRPPGYPDALDGTKSRAALRMDWSQGHNQTIQNGIGRIGWYTGGKSARFRDEDLSKIWAREADAWIAKNRARPFFLLLTPHDIHVPRMPNEMFQGKSKLGPRGDMILEFDWIVGEVMKSLRANGLDGRTLVILSSDNGPVLDDGYRDRAVELNGDHRPAGPCRGGKYDIWEGGTRVPFIVSWPGTVQPGVAAPFVSQVDLAASLARLAGGPPPDDAACVDSLDVLDALLGRPGAKGREVVVEQDNGAARLAIREGDHKLIRFPRQKNGGFRYGLYDLAADPGETKDIFKADPETAGRLVLRLNAIIAAKGSRAASSAAQVRADAPFAIRNTIFGPHVAKVVPNPVPFRLHRRSMSMLVDVTVEGRPCTMMLDTGATHTVLDAAFVKSALPGAKLLDDLEAAAGSNTAESRPRSFTCASLRLGNTDLTDFRMIVMDLSHVSRALGMPVAGILGANVLGYAPFEFDGPGRTLTWLPALPRPCGVELPAVRAMDCTCIALMATANGRTFPMLLDSGASVTTALARDWPAGDAKAEFGMVGVRDTQAARMVDAAFGAPADLAFGEGTKLPGCRPVLMRNDPQALLGMDLLEKMVLRIDYGRPAVFRPPAKDDKGQRR